MSQERDSLVFRLRDYIAGSFGGITQVLIGQPFDTIKVRIQSAPSKIHITECIKDLIHNEGITALYKGVASPLICMSAITSIQFGVFQNSMRILREFQKIPQLPIYQVTVCGCISGFSCSGIVGPMEHIRIQMQFYKKGLQKVMKTKVYANTLECTKAIIKQYGIRRLYGGFGSTLLREVPGEGVYFLAYEFQMRKLRKYLESSPHLVQLSPMIAGGIAGLIFWMVMYPVDTLKSRQQGDSLSNPKQTVSQEGALSLYKGVKVCAIRSIPVNAFGFLAFEEIKLAIEVNHAHSKSIH